jgi:hypothetical protein
VSQEGSFLHPDGSGRRIPKGDYLRGVHSHANIDRVLSTIYIYPGADYNAPVLDRGLYVIHRLLNTKRTLTFNESDSVTHA